jgi:hypothetical protein
MIIIIWRRRRYDYYFFGERGYDCYYMGEGVGLLLFGGKGYDYYHLGGKGHDYCCLSSLSTCFFPARLDLFKGGNYRTGNK